MYDAAALFLKYKHIVGCSFFELMLQYVPVNNFSPVALLEREREREREREHFLKTDI